MGNEFCYYDNPTAPKVGAAKSHDTVTVLYRSLELPSALWTVKLVAVHASEVAEYQTHTECPIAPCKLD